jgi:hypothetical protein
MLSRPVIYLLVSTVLLFVTLGLLASMSDNSLRTQSYSTVLRLPQARLAQPVSPETGRMMEPTIVMLPTATPKIMADLPPTTGLADTTTA